MQVSLGQSLGVIPTIDLQQQGEHMTSVYITQTGTKYHSRTDMSCLDSSNGVRSVDLAFARASGLVACTVCSSPSVSDDVPAPAKSDIDDTWLRAINDWDRNGVFGSRWERAFATQVLSRIPDLAVDDVELQHEIGVAGRSYLVDFYIPKARLVLEIDGFAKNGSAPTRTDVDKRNRRNADLGSKDLQVLHFSNAQVEFEPELCKQQVMAAVAVRTRSRGRNWLWLGIAGVLVLVGIGVASWWLVVLPIEVGNGRVGL